MDCFSALDISLLIISCVLFITSEILGIINKNDNHACKSIMEFIYKKIKKILCCHEEPLLIDPVSNKRNEIESKL
jgi:hypothetical protein